MIGRRITGLLLVLGAVSPALANPGVRMICRYTGQTVAPCPCPPIADEAPPAVEGAGCCEIVRATLPDVDPGRLSGAPAGADAPLAIAGSPTPGTLPVDLSEMVPFDAGADPPLDRRRYLTLRQLLI